MRKEDIERIAPDMRAIGKVENLLIPPFDQRKSKAEVEICKTLLGGKWLGKNTALQEEYLPRADGTRLRLLVIQPKDTTPDGPGLLWIHGGGYGTGVPEQDFFYIDRFCTAANCTVVTPDYRLSYEAPYPAGLQDCYAALKWMRGNASRFGIHTDQLFVGGDSAGGGMAAAVALPSRTRAGPFQGALTGPAPGRGGRRRSGRARGRAGRPGSRRRRCRRRRGRGWRR